MSKNGSRRVDVVVDESRPKGNCKLMTQNLSTGSKAAGRTRDGARISWIIPMDDAGKHTLAAHSNWGCIEAGRLTKNCAAVLNQDDVTASRAPAVSSAPKKVAKKRKLAEANPATGATKAQERKIKADPATGATKVEERKIKADPATGATKAEERKIKADPATGAIKTEE